MMMTELLTVYSQVAVVNSSILGISIKYSEIESMVSFETHG